MNSADLFAGRYKVECFWSEVDGGYIAVVPELSGCCAFGTTRSEAALYIDDAITNWLRAARAAGAEIPRPTDGAKFDAGQINVHISGALTDDYEFPIGLFG